MSNDTARHVRRPDARRRPPIVRLVLAGGLLVGVGAAVTTAAWTDSAVFTAGASTPTIQLQGGNGALPASTDWMNADANNSDGKGTAVTIPSTAFANLAPSVAAQVHIAVKNASTVPLTVPAPTVTWSGDFAAGQPCALAAVTSVTMTPAAPVTLAAGAATTDVVVSVTPPTSWNGYSTCQNRSGTLTLTFTGSTS